MKLHASREDCLESGLILQKRLGTVRSVDDAQYKGVSKPSVCMAVNTLTEYIVSVRGVGYKYEAKI